MESKIRSRRCPIESDVAVAVAVTEMHVWLVQLHWYTVVCCYAFGSRRSKHQSNTIYSVKSVSCTTDVQLHTQTQLTKRKCSFRPAELHKTGTSNPMSLKWVYVHN
jgi:hypothetical protein